LHNQQKQGDPKEKLSISLAEVERVVKQFKTHRCALDFDFRFIEAEVAKFKCWPKGTESSQKGFAEIHYSSNHETVSR